MEKSKKLLIAFIGILTIFFSIFISFNSKQEKDFIYVVPKIKNMEVLDRDVGDYSILNSENKEINFKQKNFLNGKLFLDVPNGTYNLVCKYMNTKYIPFKKTNSWERIEVSLKGDPFSKKQESLLNIITSALIILNLFMFKSVRVRLKRDKILNFLFFILIIKLFFSYRSNFQPDLFKIMSFLVTNILGFTLVYYILENIISKKNIYLRIPLYISLSLIYIYNITLLITVISPQNYAYILSSHGELFYSLRFFNKAIDISKIIFFLILFNFFTSKNKIKKERIIYWLPIGVAYFIIVFFNLLFPDFKELNYFIKTIEYLCLYWGIVFIVLRVYRKDLERVIRYILGFSIAYVSLFYFKTIAIPIMILGTTFLLDFYSLIFNKIFISKNDELEKSYNKLSLAKNKKEFETQLEKEIKKHTNINNLKVKLFKDDLERENHISFVEKNDNDKFVNKRFLTDNKYSFAIRMEFNKNMCIGAIFIETPEKKLTIADTNYLLGIVDITSNLASGLRLTSIYEELNLDD